jgi:hypothetical protein
MSREAIGRAVVRLYPRDIRDSTGAELVGTLLDAGDASRGAYVAQLVSLARSGLWARARSELTQPLGRIAATAVCWVAVMSAMSVLVGDIGIRLRWSYTFEGSTETLLYLYIIPAVMLLLFTLRRDRTTGILGLAWLAIYLHQHPMLPLSGFLQSVPLQAAGFALLAIRPRTPLAAGRCLWPAPAIVWLIYQVTLLGQLSGVGKTTPVLAALVLLPWAPSLALGTAITWALTAIYYVDLYQGAPFLASHLLVEAIELLACVPLALIAGAIARRVVTRAELHNQ